MDTAYKLFESKVFDALKHLAQTDGCALGFLHAHPDALIQGIGEVRYFVWGRRSWRPV